MQQIEINRGVATKQTGQKLVNDMAQVALKNEKIKQVLARNGVTLPAAPSPSPAVSGSAAATTGSASSTSSPAK